MRYSRHGFILNTGNYAACVRFYRDVLGLKVLFRKEAPEEELTCFEFGSAYLMVEPGGVASARPKAACACPAKLRLNTPNLWAAISDLRSKGVDVDYRRHSWGSTAEFHDPDGNRCALRSQNGFGQ